MNLFLDLENTVIKSVDEPVLIAENLPAIQKAVDICQTLSIFSFAIHTEDDAAKCKHILDLVKETFGKDFSIIHKDLLKPILRKKLPWTDEMDFSDLSVSKEDMFQLFCRDKFSEYESDKFILIDVTVEGSVVFLKILHQTREVTDFFRSAKSVGLHYIESMGSPEIREIGSDRLKVFIKGSSSAECATLTTYSQANALRIASQIAEIFDTAQKTWPELFGTSPKTKATKSLNVHKDSFLPGKVFMDVKDGELFTPTTSSGIGFSLSQDRAIEYNIKSSISSWVLVGSMSEAIKIFGSDFTKSKVLKKFRELNKTAVKQPWHK